MFDNPYAFLRWIAILSAIALLIYRYELLREVYNIFKKKKSSEEEEIKQKVEELLNKRNK